MPIYRGDTELTSTQQVRLGDTPVTAVFAGDTLIFPTTGGIILSGTITANVINASVSPLMYSVSGTEGDTVGVAFTVTPDSNFVFNEAADVTVNGLTAGIASISLAGNGNIIVDVTFTIPAANATNDFGINGSATAVPSVTITGPTTGAVNDDAFFVANVVNAFVPSFQWQTSTDGSTWTDIGTDISTLTRTWTAQGTFFTRVVVTQSGQEYTSNIIATIVTGMTLPAFACSDSLVSFGISAAGSVSLSTGDSRVTNIQITGGSSFPPNTGCSSITRVVQYSFQVASTDFSNNGATLNCSYVGSQPGSGANFGANDWTGTLNVDVNGNVTLGSTGNVATATLITDTCTDNSSGCSAISCSAIVNVTGIPSGFCNSGGTASLSIPLSVPPGQSGFGCGDWTGGVSVDSSGNVSVIVGNAANAVLTSASNVGGANQCTTRSGTSTLNVTAPSNPCNTGAVFSCTVSWTQASIGSDFGCGDANGGVFVSSDGTVGGGFTNAMMIGGFSPSSFSANSGCTSIPRTVSYTLQVTDSSFCNVGSNIFCSMTVNQPGTGVNFTGADWTGSISVDSSGNATVSNLGNATSATIAINTCGAADDCDTQTCTVIVNLGVPPGFCNSGGMVSDQITVTQSPTGSDFACSNAGISGFAVSSTGTITAPTVANGSISGAITYVGSSGGSYPTVMSATTRTATFNILVPSGECNAGALIPCSTTAVQPADQVCERWEVESTSFSGTYQAQLCGTSSVTVQTVTGSAIICAVGTPFNVSNTTITSIGTSCT